jgi:hypothetical protein
VAGAATWVSGCFRGQATYLILNPQRLRLLQDWAGQFRTWWGSDQASFENYRSYLDNDPHHP